MRWSVLLVAAVLFSGCSAKETPAPEIGIPATDLAAGNVTQTIFPLAFAGGTREADLQFEESFGPTDGCTFGFPECPATSQRVLDLVAAVPAEAPVELTIKTDQDSNVNLELLTTDTTILQMSDEGTGSGTTMSLLLVRAPSGTISLQLTMLSGIDPDGATVVVAVHSVTRADVVPSLLPVAIELGPGDVVNATGDGLEHFVAFPPSGPALRAVQYPFSLRVPEDGAKGTYVLIGDADEALRLTGPNRTLSARLLDYAETTAVDIPANQATSFTMDVVGRPLRVGVVLETKDDVAGFFGAMDILGPHTPTLVSPDNVQVLQDNQESASCVPWCSFTLIGGFSRGYVSADLDEHLMAGTFTATVDMGTANGITAYAWSLSIRES
ncbi:MAG: hypothetical protein WC876_10000 [Candidatus Thermoplasmatota archaeon]|jgi:hypothetical protein